MVLKKLFTIDNGVNGRGPVVFSWQKEGNFLACAGANRRVQIVDRQGKTIHQVALPNQEACLSLDWDCSGEMLAVLQKNSSSVSLWSLHTKKLEQLDTGMKDLTFIKWSRKTPHLVIGNAKGGLLFYNRQTFKKVPIMGKHSKKIISGAWNSDNKLALCGEDKLLTVSDVEGTTLDQHILRGDPQNVQFSSMKGDDKRATTENTISVSLGNKSLLLYSGGDQAPLDLTFQPKYGNLMSYRWYGDGYMILGFQSGYVAIVSTHAKEIGQEVHSMKIHREALNDITYNPTMRKGASVGDNCVRTFDLDDNMKMSEKATEKFEIDNEFGSLANLEWTDDGQILTVSSKNGNLYAFLTKIPVLCDSYFNRVLYLVSLRELAVRDIQMEKDIVRIPLDIEPTFVSLGPDTAAIGMNNQAFFYRFSAAQPNSDRRSSSSGPLGETQAIGNRIYSSIIDVVRVSSRFAAVLMEGRVTLHTFEEQGPQSRQRVFPDKDGAPKITSVCMTDAFLIYANQKGTIVMFGLNDFQPISEYKHAGGVRSITPNLNGTRIFFVDNNGGGHIFNPNTEATVTVEGFIPSTTRILWDIYDYGVLVGMDSKTFVTYVYSPYTRHGAACVPIMGTDGYPVMTSKPYGFNPVVMAKGIVTSQTPTGALATTSLQSHEPIAYGQPSRGDAAAISCNLQLNRVEEALRLAALQEHHEQVADRALHLLRIDLAIRAYRILNKPGLVMALEKILHIQENNLLLGHIAVMFHNYNDAQGHFMRSSRPQLALEMRRDLMHWDQALQLAHHLAPDQLPFIAKEYAQQLEFRGEYPPALDMYQKGYMPVPEDHGDAGSHAAQQAAMAHNDACRGGAARCMMHVGNLKGGMDLCAQSNSKQLCNECATILETMKQFDEAAHLFERADQFERAARIYIRELKQLKAAQALLPSIKSTEILTMFAKAKEAEGQYHDAETAFTQAGDWDNVVRLKVEHLKDLHGAYVIVRRTKSADAAAIVAGVCQKQGEISAAIEFLLLAKKVREAYEVAAKHNEMLTYTSTLLQQVAVKDGVAAPKSQEHFLPAAQYYDNKGDRILAGDFYQLCAQYTKAVEMFLAVGTDDALGKAIGVVGKARNDAITHKVVDYLMGESDGEPKDPTYIFKLYMSLKNYEKAGKTAVIIAKKEQEIGSYRAAHKVLLETHMTLQEKGSKISNDLRRALMLVHSYIIVKHLVKPMDDHSAAARMLIRVAKNIQKFPKHVVPILTSTVMECQKVDFKATAFQYACVLVQPENHSEIPEKQRKKVDTIVRKKGKEELVDPAEGTSPCPFCQVPVADTTLECGACKNSLPFCIVSGRHMVLDDWTQCPNCNFPALHSYMTKLLMADPHCPMCDAEVHPRIISKKQNPDPRGFYV